MTKVKQINNKILKINSTDKIIIITKKLLKFGQEVYQLQNVTGFSEGQVNSIHIPWLLIIFFVIGALNFFNLQTFVLSFMIVAALIIEIVMFLITPKKIGLVLTFNSGEHLLFATKDQEGVKKVLIEISDFIENQTKKNYLCYQISISDNSITGSFFYTN